MFSHITFGHDNPKVLENKPAKDIYITCMEEFANPPESFRNVVVFEDSFIGISGALASGMTTVLINNNRLDIFDSLAHNITYIVDTFDEFKPEVVGLIPYN